jgi:hypothetical protein
MIQCVYAARTLTVDKQRKDVSTASYLTGTL